MVDIELTKKGFISKWRTKPNKSIVLNWEVKGYLSLLMTYIYSKIQYRLMKTRCFPDSRIKVLEYPINNIMGAYESRQEIINHRGARGIITNRTMDSVGNVPIPDDEKGCLREEL